MQFTDEDIKGFLSNTRRTEKGCLEWLGSLDGHGYPQIFRDGKTHRVHRVVAEKIHGPLGRLKACHSCDNRHCISPDHLWPGTQRQNVQDAANKGRMKPLGEKWFRPVRSSRDGSKTGGVLTANEVAFMKLLLARGWSSSRVCRYYGCSKSLVAGIRRGERWGWVACPYPMRSS
jgi:hypothetical protein